VNGATLLAMDDIDSWPHDSSAYTNFLSVSNVKGFSINGDGVIEGQGAIWWEKFRNGDLKYHRPFLVVIQKSTNIQITDVTLSNSPMFHLVTEHCVGVEINGITITASPTSPNTDGIDPGETQNVHIANCHIDNGDDNIAVKPGCSNITVEDCHFGHGHGASIGSIGSGSVDNVIFRRITFDSTTNGARIKTKEGGTGSVTNILYENLTMTNVTNSIVITMLYNSSSPLSRLRDIQIKNITIQGVQSTASKNPGEFACTSVQPCTEIYLSDITIQTKKKFTCQNAFGTATNVSPASCLKKEPGQHSLY